MSRRARQRDAGAILPLTLVVSVALSVVVLALVTYVTTDLKYVQTTEERADRQAAATSAITYGVERIRLGKTLCGSAANDFGPIDQAVVGGNGTTTTLTCSRFNSGLSEITGWAVVMTGEGISTDLLLVQGGGTKEVTGPMFIADVDEVTFVGAGTGLEQHSGDLWHTRGSCPGGPVSLPGTYDFVPADARGPLCTTSTWDQVVPTPTIPDLTLLPGPVNDGTAFTPQGACRVFAPGRYTGAPVVPAGVDAYFRSGVYHFDSIGTWEIKQQTIWFGHPGGLTGSEELGSSADCRTARDNDPDQGGAVVYLGGNSAINANTQGSIEFFGRTVDGKLMAIQELEAGSGYAPSTVTAASGNYIYRVAPGAVADSVVHGLVYTPNGWFGFDNSSNAAKQKLLGGAVVARISIQASASASGFEISVATTPFESDIVLTATSTSPGGASTTAQAVVEYRVDEPDPDQRVAVNSVRILD